MDKQPPRRLIAKIEIESSEGLASLWGELETQLPEQGVVVPIETSYGTRNYRVDKLLVIKSQVKIKAELRMSRVDP